MVTVAIDLLASRYHATPYGRAANEGEPEWPPAPWRLGRAIVSAWWRMSPEERIPEKALDRILQSLAPPPTFRLPLATAGHTRHYMPKPNAKSSSNTTLVLDPFVRTDGRPVHVTWPEVELEDTERRALEDLLDVVGYVGRAEAGAIVELADEVGEDGIVVAPLAASADVHDGDVIQVLCLSEDASVEALSQSTAERRRRRRLDPPAGRWVSYLRPRSALEAPMPPRARPSRRTVVALRFAVEGAVVPVITDAIRVAERYRAAVLKRADGRPPEIIAKLRGRIDGSGPSQGHVHAHYLPTDENGDGRIDHLTIWCPDGLGAEEVGILDFSQLSSWAFDRPLGLLLLDTFEKDALARGGLPFASARRWVSHTPFLPTRHPKRRGGKMVETYPEQVAGELAHRSLPAPVAGGVTPLKREGRHWGTFRRERERHVPRADLPALGFEIEFAEPVPGPIALGRNSHFGMGLFLPAADG